MNDSKVPKVALGPPRLFRQYEVGGERRSLGGYTDYGGSRYTCNL